MDKKLLLDIFNIPSRSREEDAMSSFIIDYLEEINIKDYRIDKHGNIFRLEDVSMPILNAHMDTVQDLNDTKLTKFIKIRNDILSGYGVIGGDDKCGIYLILDILKEKKVNFLFSVQEEIGCVGAGRFINENNIRDFPYALTLDRWGNKDIICSANDYGTKEFEKELFKIGSFHGYEPASGLLSDADQLNEQVSCANLSVGYYNHHTKSEFVKLNELESAKKFVIDIIENITKKFPAPKKNKFNYLSDFNFDNYDYENYEEVCFVTKKKEKNLYYLPSIDKYISPEGARRLFEDLQISGAIYDEVDHYEDDYLLDDFYELHGEV